MQPLPSQSVVAVQVLVEAVQVLEEVLAVAVKVLVQVLADVHRCW
jgi:hypothetical protein